MRWVTRSIRESRALAKRILSRYRTSGPRPLILALSGDLGSGKTAFAQGVAHALGMRARVQSPTFVLMKWYELPKPFGGRRFLAHIDAYRIEHARDLLSLGIRAMLRDPGAIIVIEWAEKIRTLIPKTAIWLRFRHGTRNTRMIEVRDRRFDDKA